MKYCIRVVASLLALSGCATPMAEPVIADFNGDSVRIAQTNIMGEGRRYERTDAEAARVCGLRGRKAEYVSTRMVDTQSEYLYLCV